MKAELSDAAAAGSGAGGGASAGGAAGPAAGGKGKAAAETAAFKAEDMAFDQGLRRMKPGKIGKVQLACFPHVERDYRDMLAFTHRGFSQTPHAVFSIHALDHTHLVFVCVIVVVPKATPGESRGLATLAGGQRQV